MDPCHGKGNLWVFQVKLGTQVLPTSILTRYFPQENRFSSRTLIVDAKSAIQWSSSRFESRDHEKKCCILEITSEITSLWKKVNFCQEIMVFVFICRACWPWVMPVPAWFCHDETPLFLLFRFLAFWLHKDSYRKDVSIFFSQWNGGHKIMGWSWIIDFA